MDNYTIFTKTAKGLGETLGKTKNLSRDQRKILKEIDGKASLENLVDQLGMDEAKLNLELTKLLAEDYIREFGSSAPPGARANADTVFGLTMPAMIEAANSQLTIGDFFRAMEQPPVQAESEAASLDFKELRQPDVDAARKALDDQAAQVERTRRAIEEEARRITERAQQQAAEAARLAVELQARQAAEQARRDTEAKARQEAELARQQAIRQEQETRAKQEAEVQARLAAEEQERARKAAEEAERQARIQAEQEARRLAEEAAKREAQERERREAEALARHQAEEEAKKLAEEQARKQAEEQARLKAEEEARLAAEARAREEAEAQARREAEELARRQAEDEAHKQAQEQARLKAWEAARRAAEELAKREAEARAKAEAEEQARLQAEEDARLAAEAEARRQAEEAARQAAAEQARRDAEEQARLKAEEDARRAAEEHARREAEEQEKRQARERARQEAEEAARLKAEEKARQKAEAKALKEAEAQAKRQAREQARQEAEEKARQEAERKAQQAAEAKAKKEAEAQAKREEKEKARLAAEEAARQKAEETARLKAEKAAKKEAEKAAKMAAKAAVIPTAATPDQALQEEDAADATIQPGSPSAGSRVRITLPFSLVKLARFAAVSLAGLSVIGLALLHVVPFNGRLALLEQDASARFGQPVKIGSLNLSLLPQPHWRLQDITIGAQKQIVIPQVNAGAALGDLFSDSIQLQSIVLESPVIDEEGLGWILYGQAPGDTWRPGSIRASKARLRTQQVQLPAFDVSTEQDNDGGWRKIILSAAAQKLHLDLLRADGALRFELTANDLVLPFGGTLPFDAINVSGTLQRDGLDIDKFTGLVYDGTVNGTGKLRWRDGWSLKGEAQARRIAPAKLVPGVFQGGALDGNFKYAMQAGESAKLLASPQARGSFSINSSALMGLDMASQVMGQAGTGKTAFNELTGDFVLDDGKVKLSKMRLAAGLLSAAGEAAVESDGKLNGHVTMDLRTASRQAHSSIELGGTSASPKFSR